MKEFVFKNRRIKKWIQYTGHNLYIDYYGDLFSIIKYNIETNTVVNNQTLWPIEETILKNIF